MRRKTIVSFDDFVFYNEFFISRQYFYFNISVENKAVRLRQTFQNKPLIILSYICFQQPLVCFKLI